MSQSSSTVPGWPPRVRLAGVDFDPITETELVERVMGDLALGQGGRIITPNVDILRLVQRTPEARQHVENATVVVADGTPLIWASRIAGTALPARVPGSDLIWSLAAAAAENGRSVYLLGGEPGTAEVAAEKLGRRWPALMLAGWESPPFGFDTSPDLYDEVCAKVIGSAPDIVFVGLGFPKQERVAARLRSALPGTWFLGCGAAIGFVAETQRRAPRWMQRSGLEWTHRLIREPRRLVRRYLVHGTSFAVRLLVGSLTSRLSTARQK